MKDQFPGYFRPTEAEFSKLWGNAFIALDASVLLGFYRYSDKTRKEFFRILTQLKDRLWLPNRSAVEFFRNRLTVIGQQEKAYEEAVKSLDKIEKDFRNQRQHPFISDELLSKLMDVHQNVRKELTEAKSAHRKRVNEDDILNMLDRLFRGQIGIETTGEELDEICKDGKRRYEKRIPPGFKDIGKDETEDEVRRYGDLIMWFEVIKKAKQEKCSFILVLDDKKEDWWLTSEGQTIGPRPELIKEFRAAVGKPCYLYQPDSFMRFWGTYLNQKVSNEALAELKELREGQERRRREMLVQKQQGDDSLDAVVLMRLRERLLRLERELYHLDCLKSHQSKLIIEAKNDLEMRRDIVLRADPSSLPDGSYEECSRAEDKLKNLIEENSEIELQMRKISSQLHEIRAETSQAMMVRRNRVGS